MSEHMRDLLLRIAALGTVWGPLRDERPGSDEEFDAHEEFLGAIDDFVVAREAWQSLQRDLILGCDLGDGEGE